MEADGETPWEACRREVREEVGLVGRARPTGRGRLPAAEAVQAGWDALPLRLRRAARRGARRHRAAGGGALRAPAGRAGRGARAAERPAAPPGRGGAGGRTGVRLPRGRAAGPRGPTGRASGVPGTPWRRPSSSGRLPREVHRGRRRRCRPRCRAPRSGAACSTRTAPTSAPPNMQSTEVGAECAACGLVPPARRELRRQPGQGRGEHRRRHVGDADVADGGVADAHADGEEGDDR